MIPTSLRLTKIKGIEIRLNLSWILIYLLVVWALRSEYFGRYSEVLGHASLWTISIVSALLFFICLLVHELSHSLVAQHQGIPIHAITMFIFGGVAHLGSYPSSPSKEIKMTIAGPAASFSLAGIFFFFSWILSKHDGKTIGLIIDYLAVANLAVGVFNLLPGFPLDGGRLLRATIWAATNNFLRATRIASISGRIIGLILVFTGVTLATATKEFGFLWLGFVGAFLERLAVVSAVREIRRYMAMSPWQASVFPVWSQAKDFWQTHGWFSVTSDGHLIDEKSRGTNSSEEPEV